jgi:preprotein translocase subunit SecD
VKQGRLVTSVVLTCLVCFGAFAGAWAANWRPKLGLDLAGGLSVVYEPVPGQAFTQADLATAAQIMTDRAEGQGLNEPQIDVQGNTIQVQIPGVTNYKQALAVIGSTAQLFFRPVLAAAPDYVAPTVKKGQTPPNTLYATNALVSELNLSANEQYKFTAAGWSAGTGSNGDNYTPPAAGAWPLLASYQSNSPDQDNATVPVILDGTSTGDGARLLLGPSAAPGTIVKTASAELSTTGVWTVVVSLTGSGTTAFNALATKYYHQLVANDLGGSIQSAPIIDATNFDGGVSITGGGSGFTQAEATSLAQDLQYGTLPIHLQILDQSFVSATLGHSSLVAGLGAGLVGLVLVMLYMIVYYRALGLVVIFGLVTTGLLIFALISILGHTESLTLDLSGVTGLIVSVGITVDSYVVYFERLKDEIRSGRTVRASVDRGFKRAFRTVVAADAVSFLGAACLYLLSVGAVKGFAYWLGISTLIDVATAYFFTRPAVILLGRNRIVTEARVIGIARGLAASTGAPT